MDPVYRWPSGPTALRTSSTFSAMRSKLTFPQHQSCHRKRAHWRNDQPLYPNRCSTKWGTWHVTFTGQSQSDSNYLRRSKSCLSRLYCQLWSCLATCFTCSFQIQDDLWARQIQEKVRDEDRIQKDIHIPQPDILDIQRTPCHLGCLTLGCRGVNLYVAQYPNLCSWWVKFRDYNLTPLEETRLYLWFSKLLDCEGPNNSCVSKLLGLFWRWKKNLQLTPHGKTSCF